jgi:hypothetical protein
LIVKKLSLRVKNKSSSGKYPGSPKKKNGFYGRRRGDMMDDLIMRIIRLHSE